MSYVMQIVGTDFELFPNFQYLEYYDPDGNNGRGDIQLTGDIKRAMKFDSFHDVMETWKRPSTIRPLRPDGKPNRPLSAFTIGTMKVDEL